MIKAGLKIIIKSIMTMMITIKSIITSSSTHVAMSCSDRTPPSRLLAGKINSCLLILTMIGEFFAKNYQTFDKNINGYIIGSTRAKPIIINIAERYWYFYSARIIVFGMYRLSLFAALYRCLPECLKRVMFTQMFEEEDVYL